MSHQTEWTRVGAFYPADWSEQDRPSIPLVEWRPRGFRAENDFTIDKLDRFCIDHLDTEWGIDIEEMNPFDRVTHWYGTLD